MNINETKEWTAGVEYTPMDDLTNYHKKIEEKYKNLEASEIKANSNTIALMAFNGYYAMKNAEGAFFTVDTNMHIQAGSSTPIYDISLIVSLDGKTSSRFAFTGTTGTFDGTHLKLITPAIITGSADIDITFTRIEGGDGATASFAGTIALPKESSVHVQGTTYNNPIPYSMYIGEYYEKILDIIPIPVMQLEEGYVLKYDYGGNDGVLTQVPAYTYNLNMYFFSFTSEDQVIKLIMGTSASGGLVCNNMTVVKLSNSVATRSLQTIKLTDNVPSTYPLSLQSKELGKFSGYYQISSNVPGATAPGAFVSIEGQYTTSSTSSEPTYKVLIGISLDGKISVALTFDTTMTFSGDTLTINDTTTPAKSTSITFARGFTQQGDFGSLVTITGTVIGHSITGQTPLNPVPLIGFGGASMKSIDGKEVLTVNSDSEITYNHVTTKDLLYVPVMYILAFHEAALNNEFVLSFGTDGVKGNTCIVTNVTAKPPKISVVYAIP